MLRVQRALLKTIFVASPFIILCFIFVVLGDGMYHPAYSDEFGYWRELYNSFADNTATTGLNIYATYETRIGNYSSHGLSPYFLWYIPGKLFGWHYWSIPVYNALFVSISFLGLLAIVKPNDDIIYKVLLSFASLSVVWIYTASSMAELFQYGIITIGIALIYHARHKKSLNSILLLCVFYVFAGFCRIIYFVYFFPIAIIVFQNCRNRIKRALIILSLVLLSIFIYLISGWTTSMYPFGFMYELSQTVGLIEKSGAIAQHGAENIRLWFSVENGPIHLVITRYAYTFMIAYYSILLIIRKHKRQLTENDWMIIDVIIMSVLVWILQVLFYDVFDWRDYRTMYPFIWQGMLVAIFTERQKFVHFLVGVQFLTLICSGVNVEPYYTVLDEYAYEPISERIKYNENADSRWDNTVYQDYGAEIEDYLLLDQGIGIVWGDIYGNEQYIIDRSPRYILTKNQVEIPGYLLEITCEDKLLYVREK